MEKHKLIYNYIKSHIYCSNYLKKLPLVFFDEYDLDVAINILKYKNIPVNQVKFYENESISCRRFPYSCEEVKIFEHNIELGKRLVKNSKSCSCYNLTCYCTNEINIERTYSNFEDFTFNGFCENGCCSNISVKKRYVVYYKNSN